MNRFFFATFTILLVQSGCTQPGSTGAAMLNQQAVLKGNLPVDPLEWRVITCGTNPQESTMSTLFGNDQAVEYSRRHAEGDYPAGSILALVTWRQQADTRWFGANMPAETKSVEFVTVDVSPNGKPSYSYREYEGSPLREVAAVQVRGNSRTHHLLSQRAAVMP